MEAKEWERLNATIRECVHKGGNLHYNYDARLSQLIEPCSPKNGYPFIQDPHYHSKGEEETFAAIDNWIKNQQDKEETFIITNAQLELKDDDEVALQNIIPILHQKKRTYEKGVAWLSEVAGFPRAHRDGHIQAKALFNVAVKAIQHFQEQPTAFIRFPYITIHDSRVFGGFYGAPWSTYNNRTLKLMFREINPHFDIHVCTTREMYSKYGLLPDKREVGVLFTYAI